MQWTDESIALLRNSRRLNGEQAQRLFVRQVVGKFLRRSRGQARSDFIFREYFAFAAVVEGEKALRRLKRTERLAELRREALHGVRDTFFAQNILRTPRRVLAEAYLSRLL